MADACGRSSRQARADRLLLRCCSERDLRGGSRGNLVVAMYNPPRPKNASYTSRNVKDHALFGLYEALLAPGYTQWDQKNKCVPRGAGVTSRNVLSQRPGERKKNLYYYQGSVLWYYPMAIVADRQKTKKEKMC